MRLNLTRDILEALDRAADKPDWLTERLAQLKTGSEPYLLQLKAEEATALEELCAMNIRFDESGNVLPQHKPLDELSLQIMQHY
ncbi:MAG: hypothetical protein AB7I33_08685 [Gemmatimonadales bacterium]